MIPAGSAGRAARTADCTALASRVLYRSAKRVASSSPAEVVMSPLSVTAAEQPKAPSFQPAEEKWFASHGRKHGRPFRASLTPPPAPIGDALADAWFR